MLATSGKVLAASGRILAVWRYRFGLNALGGFFYISGRIFRGFSVFAIPLSLRRRIARISRKNNALLASRRSHPAPFFWEFWGALAAINGLCGRVMGAL